MTWLPWRKTVEASDDALRRAEHLRAQAQEQADRTKEMGRRVDAVSSSLERIRTENHIGPLIDSILRGSQ